MFVSLEEVRIGGAHLAADRGDWGMFMGSGAIEGGFALRTKPYAKLTTIPVKPWAARRGEAAGSQILGTTLEGLAFLVLCEPEDTTERTSETDLSGILEESLRFGGMEYIERFGEFSAGIAASMADRPRTVSGDGWRAGESFEHGSTHFVISAAASVKKGGILAGTWVSGCGGYLEGPGWAASVDFEARSVSRNAKPALSLNAFLFGSNPDYTSHEGESVLYDFLADVQASIRIKPWSLTARCAAASLTDPMLKDGKRSLMRAAIPVFELYSWLWKTDLLKSSIDMELNPFKLGTRLAADEYGLENGSLSLRWTGLSASVASGGAAGPAFGAAIGARFARSDDSSTDEVGATGEADGEETIMESGSQSIMGLASGQYSDRLHLGSIDFECSVGWKGAENSMIRNGKLQILISSKMDTEKSAFIIKGSIVQKFRLGNAGEVSVVIKCPKGGYSLDATPQEFPLLELEFSFGGK